MIRRTNLDVEVYIGDEANYLYNQKCPGGPFMPSSELNYGAEIWCNKWGRYTTIKSNRNQERVHNFICNLAVLGTKYVRDNAPVKTASVAQIQTSTISIENIYPDPAIGNTLHIQMRQSEDSPKLSWVTIT